jgi:1-acyl-sn-glycerol-3-phosphate acyltransferase
MEKALLRTYHFFHAHRLVFLLCFAGSFLVLGWFASKVTFEEDISKMLPKDKKIEKLNEVFQNSRFTERLVLMVSLRDSTAQPQPDSLTAYAGALATAFRQDLSPYISRLTDKVDDSLTLSLFGTISDHLPSFLDSGDYASMDSLISPSGLQRTLSSDYKTLVSPAGFALKSMILKDPVGISFLGLKKLQQLQYDDNFQLYDQYVMTKDQRHVLLFLTPRYTVNNTGKNAHLLQVIDRIIDSLSGSAGSSGTAAGVPYPSLQTTYFGAVAVAVGNALQLRKDTLYTQVITVVFLILFIGIYFGKKRAPIIILVPVLFGSLFALAAIYFIRGSISVIALGSGSVVLGVAVNYSLHVFNHYRHTRNIPEVIRDLAMPLTIGSFTTIGGFFCLEFVASEILKDLGLFAAFSLIGASFCSLVFLPHLLPRLSAGPDPARVARLSWTISWIDRLAELRPEYNKWLVLGILVLTVFLGYEAPKVGFEADLNRMNYMSPKLKGAEAELSKISVYSYQSVYLVTEGKNLNQALEANEQVAGKIDGLKRGGIVKKYSGVSSLLLSDSLQQVRIARWNHYWTREKRAALEHNLNLTALAQGFKAAAFHNYDTVLDKTYAPVDRSSLDQVRNGYLSDYISEQKDKATVVTLLKVAPESKQKVYDTFDSDPRVTVLDKQYLTARFVDLINNDFGSIAWMSSLLVFGVLLLTYGRLELTLVSFIPMFITFLWILGIMALLHIDFNIINIIISAFIFGMGDDYSLFIMDGLLQEYKTAKKNLSSYKSSIILSAVTTIAGLGVLVFAHHPALKSIAIISIVGILCVVIMSQILIPFLFNLLIARRVRHGRFPWTLSGFLKTLVSYTYFALGALLLTLIGWILVKGKPFGKRRSKYAFHYIKSKFIRSLIYIMVNVKKTILNPLNEDFSQPALVICNHQSFLDSLVIQMLYPKLILLTNSWVWHSPIMGGIVRLGDYYPIMQGAEGSTDLLRDKVNQGYSIVVFPEGTRSQDGEIHRFHKGAFFLAAQLGLDILPILIHGTGYTITKGDFLLKDGKVTLKFLPRIAPQDTHFGTTYAERAKLIGRYVRQEFGLLRSQREQPGYFRETLLYNFIYKGPVLEWYTRIKTAMEKNYQLFHEHLPMEGNILDIGCGYGYMSYMLAFSSPLRNIHALDYDEEKIEVAQHGFSRKGNLQFFHADALAFPMETYDGIVISDMLHYLQRDQQVALVEKCISHLRPGGVLMIRDADKDMTRKHMGTRYTEWFSTRLYGFNKTTGAGLSFFSGSLIRDIAEARGMSCMQIDKTKLTSNMIYVIRHPAIDVIGSESYTDGRRQESFTDGRRQAAASDPKTSSYGAD